MLEPTKRILLSICSFLSKLEPEPGPSNRLQPICPCSGRLRNADPLNITYFEVSHFNCVTTVVCNRDWCISRQLWWGHRIPAWLANHPPSGRQEWVAAADQTAARDKAAQKLGKSYHIFFPSFCC